MKTGTKTKSQKKSDKKKTARIKKIKRLLNLGTYQSKIDRINIAMIPVIKK